MLVRKNRSSLAVALVLLVTGAIARAQQNTYDLTNAQTWMQTAAAPEEGDAGVMARARRALAEDNPAQTRAILDPWISNNERSANPFLVQAYMLRGDALVAQNDLYDALYDYEAVIKQFASSEEFVTANDRELMIALRYANGEKRRVLLLFWVDCSDIAVELLIRIQERMPGSQLAERAAIELGDFYYRQREIKLAGKSYGLYLLNFPNGPNRLKAAQRRIWCDIAMFKGPRYESAKLLDAQVRIHDFERRYPAEAERTGIDHAMLTRLDESAAAQMLDAASWYMRIGDEASARVYMYRLRQKYPGTIAADQAAKTMAEHNWPEQLAAPAPESDTPPPADSKALPPKPKPKAAAQ